MNARTLLCIPIGHRWRVATDVHEIQPTLRCTRCGHVRSYQSETRKPSALSMRRGHRRHVGRF